MERKIGDIKDKKLKAENITLAAIYNILFTNDIVCSLIVEMLSELRKSRLCRFRVKQQGNKLEQLMLQYEKKINKIAGLAVGQDVDIEIDINANEWQGKWFNSITCWKATLRNPGQPTAAQQPQTYYQGASSTAAPVQTAIPQPPVDFGEQKDDLPF